MKSSLKKQQQLNDSQNLKTGQGTQNQEDMKVNKRVNILNTKVEDNSKNISHASSQANRVSKQMIYNENMQILIDKNNLNDSEIKDESELFQPINLNKNQAQLQLIMKDYISAQTHYKIGLHEDVDNMMSRTKKCQIQILEQEQDLDGWYKKQLAQKISNEVFQEEESKKEMKHKLLDDLLIQDTPELNQKIISSILRDKLPNNLMQGQTNFSSSQNSNKIQPILKKIISIKNKNKISEAEENQKNEGPIHITSATSGNLLRMYNPYLILQNQEVQKRMKTENLIGKIVIDKVKKEEQKLKNLQTFSQINQDSPQLIHKNNGEYSKKKQNATAAEIEEEENLRIQKLIDVGKQQVKNTLKNFKGLSNYYLDNILKNDSIKKQLEESNKGKNNLFYLKGDMVFAPYSEIEQIYLPKYFQTFEKLQQARIDEYELRICIANQIDLIKEKQIYANELQKQIENLNSTQVNNQNNLSNNANQKSIQPNPISAKQAQKIQSENMKLYKRKEMLKEETNSVNCNIEILKQELQDLQKKQASYQDNIKQLKIVRTKIRAYIKTTLLAMMQKDLTLFINMKKPIDLSLANIVSTLIKIGENIYNEYFPQFLDQQQIELIIHIAELKVEAENIKEKDLKQINDIKLPTNSQSIFSQLSYQCSKQCITQEAERRIKEITKEILSVKKPIFKLDEGTQTHTMQYESVLLNNSTPKKIIIEKQEIEENKDVVLKRLEKREAINNFLQLTVDKVKELEENELDRLEKSFSTLKTEQLSHLKNVLISIFGIIRGCEQLSHFLQFRKFKKYLLKGKNFTNKEKIDLINLFREKKLIIQDNLSEDSLVQNDENNKEREMEQHAKENQKQTIKYRDRSESLERLQSIKSFQIKNKNHINNSQQHENMIDDQTFYKTFMKTSNSFTKQQKSFESQAASSSDHYYTNTSDFILNNTQQRRFQIFNKDFSLSQSNQPYLLSERGLLSQTSSEFQNPLNRIKNEQLKLGKIVQFQYQDSFSPVSQLGRKVSFQQSPQSFLNNKLKQEF
ncbi:hypothetical protein TTHERM_00456950 (macronuclear) [Tetrahymena thermophila SB210]|uniref:Uncharacterized protein n=1 Tax=Tetrahymena thermophila (strain SB210) TaxID=312017 RepID=I7MM48_TETTS|nr:hypothetical protein TTHERM_00456950 [Tetrahymena thermophila SB210]EAS03957.2 hypothetical protein TTHERM_00456950 [Tetrahymena thermophila SB210]|eukprot:XP_001024202.2 hypothetical protein TTHERM_00456950 [Tetrahymena thermophila SB210]